MKCPFCGDNNDRVIDSRESKEGEQIRRRRECNACNRRFTSYETIMEIDYMVIKRDGRREQFDRKKVMEGLRLSCKKRRVPLAELERIVDEVETQLHSAPGREIESEDIGNYIMVELHKLDPVAYVRFASVYRDFRDINELMDEVHTLLKKSAS